jgi:hypothetical protein
MSLTQALYEMAQVFGDEPFAMDVGESIGCRDTNAIVKVLALAGHHGAAVQFLIGHAHGDAEIEEDSHVDMVTEALASAYIDGLII